MAALAVVASLAAGLGVYYLYTALVLGWRGAAPAPPLTSGRRARPAGTDWLTRAGLAGMAPREFVGATLVVALIGGLFGFLLFGGVVPALVCAVFAGALPIAATRRRRAARREQAQEAWPRLIEEIRILTGSVGRSIPQALFEVGRRAPPELRPAFAAAHREWLLSTDFARTLSVLKAGLADPTADTACETLLIAHELGGSDLDRRLAALAEDRRLDARDRKDARARQAGARFARSFVLVVPLGMAVVGLSVGHGRQAYETAFGQLMVVAGLALVVACWLWAGRIMKLPDDERVFPR